MFSAMLLAISITALAQFALYYWRAIMVGVAAQPISDRVMAAAELAGAGMSAQDFDALAGLHEMTPRLAEPTQGLGLVRAYYRAVETLGWLGGRLMPSMKAWSQREMAVCARYAAVQIDRRLARNLACAAELRSCC